MKKIILLALTALMMVGCLNKRDSNSTPYKVVVVDSCEYINSGSFSVVGHKGNCRFCEERDSIKWEKRKKEIEELVIKLKEK